MCGTDRSRWERNTYLVHLDCGHGVLVGGQRWNTPERDELERQSHMGCGECARDEHGVIRSTGTRAIVDFESVGIEVYPGSDQWLPYPREAAERLLAMHYGGLSMVWLREAPVLSPFNPEIKIWPDLTYGEPLTNAAVCDDETRRVVWTQQQ